jgi:P-type conjugative transfer protein TrbJ
MKLRSALGLTVMALSLAVPAHAQMAVIDAANLAQAVQQVSTAASELSQLEQQLNAEENMIRDLPGTIAPGLVTLAQQTQQLMQQVSTIQNMGNSLTSQLNNMYPSDYSAQSYTGIINQLASMQAAQRAAYQTSIAMQSQVAANQPAITQAYREADSESLSATGPTQATQANTQALEAVGQQLGDVQGLMVAQQNAEAQRAVEEQSQDEAATAAQSQIWQYTPPASVSISNPFPNAGN